MLLIMGDFDARVGNDARTWRRTMCLIGPGEQNKNGMHLLDFYTLNRLVNILPALTLSAVHIVLPY